jgi:Tfp pilus assembly protein PilW
MNIQNKKGYSIVEIIVYLAIFTSLSILVINSFIVILSSFNTTNMNRRLLESGNVTIERISREIRQAKNIDITNSTLSTSPGVLQLTMPDTSYVKFKQETNGNLNLYENSTTGNNLLSQHVTVTSLIFKRITTTQSEAIKIEMTLQYSQGRNTKSVNFYDTIVLRGGY